MNGNYEWFVVVYKGHSIKLTIVIETGEKKGGGVKYVILMILIFPKCVNCPETI